MDIGQPFEYKIGEKIFCLKPDFTFGELDYLNSIYNRLTPNKEQNEVNGSFTTEEIEKAMCILLTGKDNLPFTHSDFLQMKQLSQSVKVLADFFLSKAILGALTNNTLMN